MNDATATSLPLVAIFNSSDDMLYMLRMLFERNGFVTAVGHVNDLRNGKLDLTAFVNQYRPAVVVYDLVPPYEQQWAFLDHLRRASPLSSRPFVLTSTNARMARELAGRSEPVLEVVGRPFDFEELLQMVRQVLSERA
jgi:CheY-like chemotaxis protein